MSIGAVAVSKLFIMPVIGVALSQGLVKGGLIAQDAHVLRFAVCFFSAVPSCVVRCYATLTLQRDVPGRAHAGLRA